jgi:hypothetical protein
MELVKRNKGYQMAQYGDLVKFLKQWETRHKAHLMHLLNETTERFIGKISTTSSAMPSYSFPTSTSTSSSTNTSASSLFPQSTQTTSAAIGALNPPTTTSRPALQKRLDAKARKDLLHLKEFGFNKACSYLTDIHDKGQQDYDSGNLYQVINFGF